MSTKSVILSSMNEKYIRQILIPEIGESGQKRLKDSTVFIAGAGGLGSPVCMYLAAAGVGRIIVCDGDTLEESNLNRQIIHPASSIGAFKAESAAEGMKRVNPDIEAESRALFIDEENIDELTTGADLLIDCLDNFKTRFLLNRLSVRRRIPLIFAGVYSFSGQIAFFHPPETSCLQCLMDPVEDLKQTIPVLGATAGIMGSMEALIAVKYLTGNQTELENHILMFDGDGMEWTRVEIRKDPDCPICGEL